MRTALGFSWTSICLARIVAFYRGQEFEAIKFISNKFLLY